MLMAVDNASRSALKTKLAARARNAPGRITLPAHVRTMRKRPACRCSQEAAARLHGYQEPQDTQGSWLSSAFKKVTGQKLSTVAGNIAGGIPLVGGIVQGLVSGGGGGGGGSSQQTAAIAGQPFDFGRMISDILNAQTNAATTQAILARSQPQTSPEPQREGIDTKTIMIGGAVVLALALTLSRK